MVVGCSTSLTHGLEMQATIKLCFACGSHMLKICVPDKS